MLPAKASEHLGTAVAVGGVMLTALALTLFRGPWQGAAIVGGGVLLGLGLWIQRRREVDLSESSPEDAERLKDYLPGKIGGDPRPWLEKHGHSDHGSPGGADHE